MKMVEAKVKDYEKLIQTKVAGKVTDYHDYQDCCQECRIRVWQSFPKFEDGTNGLSLKNWVALQIDSAISNFLRDTYYTERAKREIPYGLLSDLELLFGARRVEAPGSEERVLEGEGRGVASDPLADLFKRWTDSREREEAELKELEQEIFKNLKPMQVAIYKLLKEGYTQREIAAGLDHGALSQPYVHKQIGLIKEVVARALRRREFF